MILWEIETGIDLVTYNHSGPVRSVCFNEAGSQFVSCSDNFSNNPPCVTIYVRKFTSKKIILRAKMPICVLLDENDHRRVDWLSILLTCVFCFTLFLNGQEFNREDPESSDRSPLKTYVHMEEHSLKVLHFLGR